MPKELHDKLEKEADEKGLTGDRKNAYIYGTMAKIEKAKKAKREKAHEAYQEEDSIFTHHGKPYSLNKVFELVEGRTPTQVSMDDLKWNVMEDLDTARVTKADPSIPIIAVKESGKYYVLDGNHRLKKLYDAGTKKVSVVLILGPELASCKL